MRSLSEENDEAIRILLNPDRLRRLDPWQLKVYVLLDVFRKYVLGMELKDFRISGIAVSTSSIIYKLKATRMFYRPRPRQATQMAQGVPELLHEAYAAEVRVGDVGELVEAFKELIDEIAGRKAGTKGIEPLVIMPTSEEEMLKVIESYMNYVIEAVKVGPVSFYDIFKGKDMLEAVRVFLAVLFLLSEGKIEVDDDLNIKATKLDAI